MVNSYGPVPMANYPSHTIPEQPSKKQVTGTSTKSYSLDYISFTTKQQNALLDLAEEEEWFRHNLIVCYLLLFWCD